MNNYIDRKQILAAFLENIFCISDKDYQERIWVKNEGPECDDIDDSVGDFFDDGDSILEKYKDYGISHNQYKLLIKLRNKLNEFIDAFSVFYYKAPTEILINRPEWQEVRKIAKEVLNAFNYKSKS